MPTRFRWVTISVVVALIVINYIDRSAISYAVTPFKTEFGITDAQYGVVSSAFSIGYAVFAFLSGPLVDRFGARKVLITAVLGFSLATALVPLAGGFVGLLLIRIVLGATEAPAFPAASRTASRWLPRAERGFALALIGGVAVSGSLLVAGPLLTNLIAGVGWRGMFWIIGGLGVLWALLAVALLRNSPDDASQVNDAERAHIAAGQDAGEAESTSGPTDWRALLTNRNLWICAIGYFSWGFMFWGFMYWLPQYLSTSFGLSIKAVGAFAVAPWAAGIVGALAGGFLVDRVYRRTHSIRSRYTIMGTALLLSGASLVPVFLDPTLTVALVSISCGVGFGFVTGGIWWVASIDAAPTQPATAAGFADAAFAISGVVAPLVMGLIVESTGTFTSGFVTMSVLAVLGALLMLFATREPTRPGVGAGALTRS
ncbi:MFS transporter [Actinomycetospora atypica]|uniref:MFS transporter n=1 Tax=Actinomycetospora atypica TaxID=1290095 RepID=A0ABV9YHA1_9PSEU